MLNWQIIWISLVTRIFKYVHIFLLLWTAVKASKVTKNDRNYSIRTRLNGGRPLNSVQKLFSVHILNFSLAESKLFASFNIFESGPPLNLFKLLGDFF